MTRSQLNTLTSPNLEFASFSLSGPSRHARGADLPVRGDLAHIRLAGEVFVPHYAVPMPHSVIAVSPLLAAARADADTLGEVEAGASFDVLDIAGEWAWGVVNGDGAVGYLRLSALESAA